MNKLFIVYTCDANHMHSSKIAIAYCDGPLLARFKINEHSLKSSEGKLKKHDRELIDTINQTQNRSENYIIEEVPLNTLL